MNIILKIQNENFYRFILSWIELDPLYKLFYNDGLCDQRTDDEKMTMLDNIDRTQWLALNTCLLNNDFCETMITFMNNNNISITIDYSFTHMEGPDGDDFNKNYYTLFIPLSKEHIDLITEKYPDIYVLNETLIEE